MPRVSNEYRSLEVTEMQTKMILRPLPTSVHSNTIDSSHFKFNLDSAWQNSEVAKRTGDFGNYIKKKIFSKVFAQSRLFITLHNCITAE